MATTNAIAATTFTILDMLKRSCPRDLFPNALFEPYHQSNFDKPMNEGVSLFLYRIAVNSSLRNLPPRPSADGRRMRPSLPVDLFYLMTAWGADVLKQQRMLGWCMRTLEDMPILTAGMLNSGLSERGTFFPNEAVELVYDPLSIQDMISIWDKLKPKMQTSVTYVARMVVLDSTMEMVQPPLVQTREFKPPEQPI